MHTFLDDYSHIKRDFDFFHPKNDEDECCCDKCEFCHEEQSVLDALHENSAAESKASAFAGVVSFICGIR